MRRYYRSLLLRRLGDCSSGTRSTSCSDLTYLNGSCLIVNDNNAAYDSEYTFLHVHSLENTLYHIFRVITKHNLRKNATETYSIEDVQHIIPTNADDHEIV